jgi:small conductance mechanosensitive channel
MRRLADRHQRENPQRASELRTLAAILRATAYGIISFIVLINVLSLLGIDTKTLLASAGVVGVGIGLGAQSLFKDMLNGIFILVEGQYNVGDLVTIASVTGTVEDLSLRITKVRDGNGTLYFIPNSQVATVSNLSRDFTVATLSVTVDATADPDKVIRVLRDTALAVRNDPRFGNIALADPDVPGVDAISGRVVTYPVAMRVRINQKDAILRELRRRVIQAFEQSAIPLGTDPPTCSSCSTPTPRPHPPSNRSQNNDAGTISLPKLPHPPRQIHRKHIHPGGKRGLHLIHRPPPDLLHQRDLIRSHALQPRSLRRTPRHKHEVCILPRLTHMLESIALRVHRPAHIHLQPKLLSNLAPSRRHRLLVWLNLPTRSKPEHEQLPILPHHRTPDQQHPPRRVKHHHPR